MNDADFTREQIAELSRYLKEERFMREELRRRFDWLRYASKCPTGNIFSDPDYEVRWLQHRLESDRLFKYIKRVLPRRFTCHEMLRMKYEVNRFWIEHHTRRFIAQIYLYLCYLRRRVQICLRIY